MNRYCKIYRYLLLILFISGLFFYIVPPDISVADSPKPPTEIVGERTENSKTYDNHDGTRGLTSYIGVIHYKDDYASADERWKDIDTTIVNGRVDKAPYVMSIDYASGIVTIKDKKTGAITTIGLKDIEGEIVKLDNPVEQGNLICFQDVAKDTDIVIEASNTHVRFKRILRSDDAPLTATFAIYQQGDGLTINPLARDNYYADVKVDSKFEDGILTETIAKYESGQLCYPIQIDPSIDISESAATDSAYMSYNGVAWSALAIATTVGYVGNINGANYKMGTGIRFRSVTIPQGSTITGSYINITAYTNLAVTTANSTICGQIGNSNTFSTAADYQSRRGTDVGGANNNLRTISMVQWDNIAAQTANVTYQSPSINTVVQEIVNNNTWWSGYNMTFFWDDHQGRSTATAYRMLWSWVGYPAYAPLLHVDYTVNNVTMNTLRCTGYGKDWLLLNGNVTAYGGPINITQLGFDYGTTTSYGSSIETTYANYTIRSYGYYQYLSGLNAQTLYHFRANGYNGSWAYDGDRWFSTAGELVTNPMEWESHVLTTNATRNVYGSNWATQSFTTNSTAHTLSQVDLWLSRIGSPGDVTVEIQQAGSNGLPYGTVLAKGTIAGAYTGNVNPISTNTTARYSVALTPTPSLAPNTLYCATVKALGGDYNNYLRVGQASPYSYGVGYTSSDNGNTWADSGQDFFFDLWGFSCLQVDYAQVFNTFKNAGDWLMVFFYRNTYPPYYPVNDAKQFFAYQLVDSYNTVKAQSACQEWGARPGSLYLSAATVSGLQWSGDYRIRLVNIQNGAIYMEYPLQAADWSGTDLSLLDAWVLSMAQQLQLYDGVPYITSITGRGNVLNAAGGVIFATGIPLLDTVRPNLFQTVSQPGGITSSLYPQTLRQTFQPATMLGPDAFAAMTAIGNVFGTDGRTIGAAGLIIIVLVIAGWGFQPGHTVAATVICMPIFIIGMLTGIIDLLIGAIGLAIATIVFIWKAIFQGG
jgi:hypothetical protein